MSCHPWPRIAAFTPLLILAAAGLLAQKKEFTFVPDHVGTIEPISIDVANADWKLSAADQKLFKSHIEALRDLILSQPVFKPPKGFLVKGYFHANEHGGRAGIPVRAWGVLRYHPFVFNNDYNTGKPTGNMYAHEYNPGELFIYVNDPTAVLGHFNGGPYFPFDDTPVLFEPIKIGERQGFSLYTLKQGNEVSPFLIITRSTKPLWVPLSKEAFLQILIKHYDARHAAKDSDYPSADPANNMRAALAKMTATERAEQAWYLEHYDYSPPLSKPGAIGAVPLVMPNPELFDPALPRTTIQLITVEFRMAWNLKNPTPDQWDNPMRVRHAQTLETSDWKSVSALLNQK